MATINYILDNVDFYNKPESVEDNTVLTLNAFQTYDFLTSVKFKISVTVTKVPQDINDTDMVIYNFNEVSGDLTINITSGQYYIEAKTEEITDLRINLYQNYGENNKLNKSNDLTLIDILDITFKNECDVINPVVIIKYDKFPECNYAYITSLNKFYFINSKVIVNNNLYELYLEEDVLMSFKHKIENQTCFIERNENTYELNLPDTELTAVQGLNIHEVIIPNNVFFVGGTDQTNFNYIASGIKIRSGDSGDPTLGPSTRNNGWLNSSVGGYQNFSNNFISSIVLNYSNANKLVNMFTTKNVFDLADFFFEDSRDYISNLQWFPLHIPYVQSSYGYLRMPGLSSGDLSEDSQVQGYRPSFQYEGRSIFQVAFWDSSTFEHRFNDFRDYEGYTKIEIFLPYLGNVDVSCNDFYSQGKCMKVFLEVDFLSGLGTYYITACENEQSISEECRILSVLTTQLGFQIPLGQSNAIEVMRNATLGTVKAFVSNIGSKTPSTSVTTSTTKVTGGKKTTQRRNKKDELIGTNITKTSPKTYKKETTTTYNKEGKEYDIGKDIANAILDNCFVTTSSDRINSPLSMFNASQDVIIVVKQPKYELTRNIEYLKLNGAPLRKTVRLSSLSGFTIVSNLRLINFNNATSEEIDMITNILLNGVIL